MRNQLDERGLDREAPRRGVDQDPRDFAGHSLRAGLATSAAADGVSERAIMNQTGHRSLTMVRHYIRDGELFPEVQASNASSGLAVSPTRVLAQPSMASTGTHGP